MDAPIEDVYYALDYSIDYMGAFYAACKLAQKELIRIDPFPTLALIPILYEDELNTAVIMKSQPVRELTSFGVSRSIISPKRSRS